MTPITRTNVLLTPFEEDQLSLLEQEIEEIRFPADFSLAKKRLPFLAHLQRDFSPKLANLYLAINRQMAASTVGNRSALILTGFKKDFLQKFYPLSPISYSKELEERCQMAANRLLGIAATKTPKTFRKQLAKEIFKEQLESAQVPRHCHEHLLSFSKNIETTYRQILSHYKQKERQMRPFPLRQAIQKRFPKLARSLNSCKKDEIKESLRKLALKLLEKLYNEQNDLEIWEIGAFKTACLKFSEEILSTLPPFEAMEANAEQVVKKTYFTDEQFFKYMAYTLPEERIFEYSQGEQGPGTSLGRGVCTGLCIERALLFLQNPKAALNAKNSKQISSSARAFQAFYEIMQDLPSLQKKKDPTLFFREEVSMLIPKKLREKIGINWSDTKSFSLSVFSLTQAVEEIFNRLYYIPTYSQEPSCFLSIHMENGDGHALYMRFDYIFGRYILFDANYGTFEKRTHLENEGMAWLFHALIHCLGTYEQITSIRMNHYILETRETKETLDEEIFRYQFIKQFC